MQNPTTTMLTMMDDGFKFKAREVSKEDGEGGVCTKMEKGLLCLAFNV